MDVAKETRVSASPSWRSLLCSTLRASLVLVMACGPSVEDPEPIPEHRLAPCEAWCDMLFAPNCHPGDVEVASHEECVQRCTVEKGLWAPVEGEERDACEEAVVTFYGCMTALSCEEQTEHFDSLNEVPYEDLQCGAELVARMDCSTRYGAEYLE